MLIEETNLDLKDWTPRERMLLQFLIDELRAPFRTGGKFEHDRGEIFRSHDSIRKILKEMFR